MPRKRRPADDPVEWLNRARSNLARAKADIRIPHVYLEDLCFDAQQAAEKAIKAVLLKLGVTFPFIHDLGDLLTLSRRQADPFLDRSGMLFGSPGLRWSRAILVSQNLSVTRTTQGPLG